MIRVFTCSECKKKHQNPIDAINCHVIKKIRYNLCIGDIVRLPSVIFKEINNDEKWIYNIREDGTKEVFFVISLIEKISYCKSYDFTKYHLSSNAFDGISMFKTGYVYGNQKHKIIRVDDPPREIKKDCLSLLGERGAFNIQV